ncbi:MAG: bifunctional UDP-N-acetylglucosamine diphosphorylase/glucosamine-1-phosphate N-acetyltransferase GlmU [Pseudomonadales bacterium]|nr:bifunctional UDP-N-acetylglucosamine diphosphorylase/glucosamine-1-phosphate N-acetyltransferase GlmU [Pseudomonadales bacterium]
MTKNIEICILAAGKGSRMKSDRPKVLQEIAGQPMLLLLLETALATNPTKLHVVVGSGAATVKDKFSDWDVNWVLQGEQKGTGHAVLQAAPYFSKGSKVLILVGDAPLLSLQTMQQLISLDCELGILTVEQPNPFNYGRIIRDGERLLQIVEEKDASEKQKKITEINSGVMIADADSLRGWLGKLDTENAQGEYLLTDVVAIANKDNSVVRALKCLDSGEVQGVNDFRQLALVESYYQHKLAEKYMLEGAHIVDPGRINIRGDLRLGRGVYIDINCIFIGEVTLADNVIIGANCIIQDSIIGENSVIKPNTMLDGAEVSADCAVGPFARIRPGTKMAEKVAIGNFVEIKKTTIGKGSKASHLTYLGDSLIGERVNIGAGTITCNYDGVNKFITEIADNVFVGSNSSLVAPVKIAEGSTIAAGSTVTKTVPEKSLAIARGRQKNITNWKGPRD